MRERERRKRAARAEAKRRRRAIRRRGERRQQRGAPQPLETFDGEALRPLIHEAEGTQWEAAAELLTPLDGTALTREALLQRTARKYTLAPLALREQLVAKALRLVHYGFRGVEQAAEGTELRMTRREPESEARRPPTQDLDPVGEMLLCGADELELHADDA